MGLVSALVATAVIAGSAILSKKASDKAADASLSAASMQANYQMEALEYLKERDKIPSEARDEALLRLQGLYGEGGQGEQRELIQTAMDSPLYKSLMAGREFGEEAILRNASATGGLRSGNVQSALYDYNVQLRNNALLTAYNDQIRGIGGLAGLNTNENMISEQMAGIGTTLAQGQVASAQAKQQGTQNAINTVMGFGNLGVNAYGAGMFSDRRLKKNITLIGKSKGWNIYSWEWNVVAQKMGLKGRTIGCMADEVYNARPDAVFLDHLFMMIDYSKIGLLEPYNLKGSHNG